MFQDVSYRSSPTVSFNHSILFLKFITGLNLQNVTIPVCSVSRAISRSGQVSGQPHDVS